MDETVEVGYRRIALAVSVSIPLIGMAGAAALDLSHGSPADMTVAELVTTTAAVGVTALLGWRILRSRPGHLIGLILVVMANVGWLTTLLEVYAFAGLVNPGRGLPLDRAADVASSGSWVTAYAALTALAFFFPDGRLPGARWRPFVYLASVAFGGAWLAVTLQPGRQDEPFDHLLNPAGQSWLGGPGQIAVGVVMIGMLACMAVAAGAVADRYVASTGVERLQLKWLTYSIGLVPLALGGCYLGDWLLHSHVAANIALQVALVVVPGSVSVAVLRYRLYEIDRLVNRTAVYAALTVALAAVYGSVSVAFALVAGRGSALPTAAATLVAALAFRPVRARLQDAVDRQFSRAKYDGRRLVATFVEDLRRDRADPSEIEAVIGRALGCTSARIGLWVPSHRTYVAPDGSPLTIDQAHPAIAEPPRLDLGGSHHAVVLVPPDARVSDDLVSAVLSQAKLALHVAALRAEVVVQATSVAEARIRLVEATFEERRRLERDLHDGAQQRLVYLGINLRRLQKSLPAQARILEPALEQAVQQVAEALSELRNLARGALPARLSKGLGPALQDLAATSPVPVRLDLAAGEAPGPVEAVAYFTASEALTNALKHGRATSLSVATSLGPDGFCLSVSDDGVGGARYSTGGGLAGVRSRVAAHGGVLELSSPPGSGTVVKVRLPCE